jgi:carboxypeptidase Q
VGFFSRSRVAVASSTVFLVLALATARAEEAKSVSERLRSIAAQDDQVMHELDRLVNGIGPRLTGSSNLEKAYEWTRAELERFGLQNAHTEVWGEWAVGFDRAGPTTGKVIVDELGEKPLVCQTHAWTASTNGPRRGHAIWEPRTLEELEKVKGDLKGAWLVSRQTRGGFGGRGGGSNELRKAFEEAGIAGRVVTTGRETIITDGSPRGITMDKLPKSVTVMVNGPSYEMIKALFEQGMTFDLEFDAKNVFTQGPVKNKNVIADIPGTEHPDEFVIVGGHLDSWDGATGTQDNGTGVATTLEAARLLMKVGAKPKRTIRFVLFSGEEQGLLGSAGYAKKHADELSKISCVLIHDGGTNYVAGLPATAAMAKILKPALEPLEKWDANMPFKVREVQNLPYGIGSDHDTFLGKGVPGLFWDQKGKSDYDHVHHTQFDTYDSAVPEYQRHSAVTIASAALAIADLDVLLPREGMLAPRGQGNGQRKMLGVQCNEDMSIEVIVEGSLAEKAGLKEGDKITAIGAKQVANPEELRAAIQASEGDTVVRFVRDGKEQTVTVAFAKNKPIAKKRWL